MKASPMPKEKDFVLWMTVSASKLYDIRGCCQFWILEFEKKASNFYNKKRDEQITEKLLKDDDDVLQRSSNLHTADETLRSTEST